MNLYHYEFTLEEIGCQCQRCEKLNAIEMRGFMLIEDEKENEERMQYLNEFSREIASARKNVDDLGKRIQQARLDIEEFGRKKFSDLLN